MTAFEVHRAREGYSAGQEQAICLSEQLPLLPRRRQSPASRRRPRYLPRQVLPLSVRSSTRLRGGDSALGALGASREIARYPPHVEFPRWGGWPDWQRDYRYGALVIEPPGELAAVLDPIRERFDPVSASRVGAHITVTPPFIAAPGPPGVARVGAVVSGMASMSLQLGKPRQFGGSSVTYLPVVNGDAVMRLREQLLATGLFRLDLPHTTDFVPHLTISEVGITPAAALSTIIPPSVTSAFHVGAVAWMVPDEGFQFAVRRMFRLEADE